MPNTGVIFFTNILPVIMFILTIQVPVAYTDTYFHSKNISSSNVEKNPILTSNEPPLGLTVKKWQVGRVSRKHYEIVNMLWRKTKIFVDPEKTTPIENRLRRNHPTATLMAMHKNIKPLSSVRPFFQSSTPSFIEFYYLDDNDERIRRRDSLIPIRSSTKTQEKVPRNNFKGSPVLSFRVDDHYSNSPHQLQKRPMIRQKPRIYGSDEFEIGLAPKMKSNTLTTSNNHKQTVTTEKLFDYETCPITTVSEIEAVDLTKPKIPLDSHNITNTTQDDIASTVYEGSIITSYDIEPTTIYDKIKFFEMYDQETVMPNNNDKSPINKYDSENMDSENEIDGSHKVNLNDVDHKIGHHDGAKVKNVKKHADEKFRSAFAPETHKNNQSEKRVKFKTVIFSKNKTNIDHKSNDMVTAKTLKKQHDTWDYLKNSSRVAKISQYPFAAVYVYEPSQIHCDAAALSSHWLVAAGSCLSRFQRKDEFTNDLQGRSAFVAYCGRNWWRPERVSYVKYSIVHPRFHPKENTRRFLYNIGLIQVVGSMSSCFGWAPISLMSHNFAASDGSTATAVGWGLDRYDVRYTSADLPKQPLSAYDGFVFSNSCPGSKEFGKMKLYNDQQQSSAVKNNLYCLSLPPYSGEENDPIHGSLLLVGGKLIALYLQEERRIWGEQSAQYTGVWRLVPWVHEVAREPDESDGFIDI